MKYRTALFFSDAWRRRRRRRRRRRGKMDEGEMEIPEDHRNDVSPEAKRKIHSALFGEELQGEQKLEDDAHPKYAPA